MRHLRGLHRQAHLRFAVPQRLVGALALRKVAPDHEGGCPAVELHRRRDRIDRNVVTIDAPQPDFGWRQRFSVDVMLQLALAHHREVFRMHEVVDRLANQLVGGLRPEEAQRGLVHERKIVALADGHRVRGHLDQRTVAGIGGKFLVLDVGAGAKPLRDPAVGMAQRQRRADMPAIRCVRPAPDAVLDFVAGAGFERLPPTRLAHRHVFRMDHIPPAPFPELGLREACVLEHPAIEEIQPAVRTRGPDHVRDALRYEVVKLRPLVPVLRDSGDLRRHRQTPHQSRMISS